jgi:O-antigen/teichoic acid export membrane protein
MTAADTAADRPRPRGGPGRRRRQPRPGQTYGFATLFKDSIIYGSGRALQKFLSMLLLPLYTSYLTPKDYGVLGLVLAFSTLIDVIITLGWDVTFSRFYFDDDTELHRRKVITQTFYVDTVYPFVLLGVLAYFMPQISRAIMGGGGYTLYFDLALINLAIVNINDIPFQLFRLDHKPWRFTTFTVGRIFVQVPITIVLVAVVHWGVKGVLVGTLVTSIVLAVAALPFWVTRLKISWEPALFWSMLSFAVANFFANVAFYALNFSDRYLLRWRGNLREVGLYVAAGMMAQPVYFAGYAFRMAWPQWHYSFLKDPQVHKQRVARGYTYFSLMSFSLVAFLGVFLPLMIRVLLRRPDYWGVLGASLLLLFATTAFNSYHLFLVGVNVTKKNRFLPLLVLVAATFSITTNIFLIPRYGFMAAALTNLLSFTLLAAMMRTLSQHYYAIPHEWTRVLRLLGAALLTLGAAYGLGAATGFDIHMEFDALLWRQALMALMLGVFPLVLWTTRFFNADEKVALRRMGHSALHPRAWRAARTAAPATQAPPLLDETVTPDPVEADLAADAASEEELAAEEERLEEEWEAGGRDTSGETL